MFSLLSLLCFFSLDFFDKLKNATPIFAHICFVLFWFSLVYVWVFFLCMWISVGSIRFLLFVCVSYFSHWWIVTLSFYFFMFLFLSLAMIVFSSGCLFSHYYFRFLLLCYYKMIDFSSVCESSLSRDFIFRFLPVYLIWHFFSIPFARRDKLFSVFFFQIKTKTWKEEIRDGSTEIGRVRL